MSEDVEWTEEEQIVIGGSNLKSPKQETDGKWSEKELLIGYDECSSNIYSSN